MKRIAAALAMLAAAPASGAVDGARLNRIVTAAGFQGVAMVGMDDAIAWSHVAGEIEPGVPHRIDSVWRYASVTKQFTALIVMQEVAAGRIELDAPVSRYWPEWPGKHADALTVRMLLHHRSGLADPAKDKQDKAGVPRFYFAKARQPAAAAAGFCAARPRTAPGGDYHYNNCDYVVLGGLLERLTGKSFAVLLQERIGAPLELARFGLFAHDAPPAEHVRGWGLKNGPEPRLNLGSYGGAGSIYGTPEDLWRFDRALMEHRLLDSATTATMWAGDPALGHAAFGSWSFAAGLRGCAAPVALIERRGAIGGVQIRNYLVPATRTAILLFTNREDFAFGEVWEGFAHDMLAAALCPEAQ